MVFHTEDGDFESPVAPIVYDFNNNMAFAMVVLWGSAYWTAVSYSSEKSKGRTFRVVMEEDLYRTSWKRVKSQAGITVKKL